MFNLIFSDFFFSSIKQCEYTLELSIDVFLMSTHNLCFFCGKKKRNIIYFTKKTGLSMLLQKIISS